MRTVQPIYYDGQVAVISSGLQPTMRAKDWLKGIIGFVRDDHDPSLDTSDLQATPATAQAAKQLRRDLAQIDTNAMALTLSERGAKISRGTLNDLIGVDGVVDNNLQAIISSPTLGDTDYIPSDYFAPFRDPSIRLVFSSDDLAGWSSCSLQGTDCTDLFLSDEEHVQLLRGRLTLAGIDYIYVGPSITSYRDGLLQDGFRNGSWSRQNLSNGVDLWTNSAVETTIDRETKTLTLKATEAEAKAVLSKGTLTDWSVVFSGVRQIDNNQTQELGQVSERYDDRGLTGCLTFRDIRLSHLSIEADGGNCEDSVHFIRAKGHVTSIAIKYAFQDALDMDFSDLEVSNTSITFSGNDCIDTSKGDYIFTQATLTRCSDKAVSLGESSIAHLHRLTVTSAPVAIASKDSSFGSIEHGYLSDVGICATTYRKKQAYSGGGLRLGTVTCDAQEYRQQPGSELAILGP
tara:strand:- start:1138 stop:2517 length:1380 start_codon:yes stop_codon:yes gene_type:complete